MRREKEKKISKSITKCAKFCQNCADAFAKDSNTIPMLRLPTTVYILCNSDPSVRPSLLFFWFFNHSELLRPFFFVSFFYNL